MRRQISDMTPAELDAYAALFASVFNAAPWHDAWTPETARRRIGQMMHTGTFLGKALRQDGELCGLIWGQFEQFYDGMHFQIQEFCVGTASQGQGIGSALLCALEQELSARGVVNIFLITSRGGRTEGWYGRHGFRTSDSMILMTNADFSD